MTDVICCEEFNIREGQSFGAIHEKERMKELQLTRVPATANMIKNRCHNLRTTSSIYSLIVYGGCLTSDQLLKGFFQTEHI